MIKREKYTCLRLAWIVTEIALLFTSFTVTFANPFKIRSANGICSHLYHFLTDFAHRTSCASQ